MLWLILTSSGGKPKPPWAKENVSFPMMNQEIRHSMEEHDRQTDMQNNQLTNSAMENTNQKQWTKFKEVKTKIQDRLRVISFAMQAVPTMNNIVHESAMIKDNQEKIIREVQDAPYALVAILSAQIRFADDLQMVMRYLVGIIASYGAINQMEKADRKILLDYAMSEVDRLNNTSTLVLMQIRDFKQKIALQRATLEYYKNRDRDIVEGIMQKIKHF